METFPGLEVKHPSSEMNEARNVSDLQIFKFMMKIEKKNPANILGMGPKSKHEIHLETYS